MTGVTDKQIKELGIDFTPQHPEEELIKAGVIFESKTALRDVFANLTLLMKNLNLLLDKIKMPDTKLLKK